MARPWVCKRCHNGAFLDLIEPECSFCAPCPTCAGGGKAKGQKGKVLVFGNVRIELIACESCGGSGRLNSAGGRKGGLR